MKSPAAKNGAAQLRRSEELLTAIIHGTVAVTGTQFFRSLVRHLAQGLHVRWVFVAECLPNLRARSLAFWQDTDFGQDFEYALPGTPCMEVAQGRTCHVPDRLAEVFPEDKGMIDMGTVSYLGVPLINSEKRIIGHLVVFHDKPMPPDPLALSVMETFAARAGAELERKQADEEVRRLRDELAARKLAELENEKQRISDQLQEAGKALSASEERLRDLFDEAPIAYVNEGLDSKFIRANRTAIKILGIKPVDVPTTYGKNFIPQTPDAQRRLREAFESIGKGIDTSGVVLELRRKDNGKPLWIQWWSRPDPSGTYTRTMFIDITERVLMEQEKVRLEAQNIYLQAEIRGSHNFEELIGSSTSLKKVLKNVERVAPTDSTVLITGETGTGKELIARAIHNLSPRKNKPLVKVNCAAIPAGLIESELFGHEKGAFTGALSKKMGRFELADKGTIFLDEIGELPLDLQSKLLRVLQEGEFERVGGTKTFKVSVRVIAATNRNLEQQAKTGHYRPDLYYRLNVFPIHLPALREREGDIPLLVQYFVRKFAANFNKKIDRISERMMATLQRYQWPGNIRELEHVIERAVILSEGSELEPIEWLARSHGTADRAQPLTLEELERQHIVDVLERTNWRVSGEKGAAKILDINPTTLAARMKKLGIKRPV